VENAADVLLAADAQTCALLKEAAIDFLAAHHSKVKSTDGWLRLKESDILMEEIMETLAAKSSGRNGGTIDIMPVATLWRELDERRLDLDGSRDMLVRRLRAHFQD
jgi:hypothetical protein